MCYTTIKHHRSHKMRKEDYKFFKNETDGIRQYPL
jgi:hypothetical protein